MFKSVLEEISEVRFRKKLGEEWLNLKPKSLATTHLLYKTRYHVKQLLACLLELRKRNIDICKELERKHSAVGYKECLIKPYDSNKLKLFLSIEREGSKQ